MIAQASGLGMAVGRFSKPLRGVQVITMQDAGVHTTRRVQFSPGGGGIRLLDPGVADGVFIDRRCVADGAEVTR
jgi:hypothetical protein